MNSLNIDRGVFLIAGTVNLIGVILGAFVSPWFLAICAFVALNMLQASVTGFCPAAMILKRFGVQSGCAFK